MKRVFLAFFIALGASQTALAADQHYFTLDESTLDGSDVLAPSCFTLDRSKLDGSDVLVPSCFVLDKSKLDGGDVLTLRISPAVSD